MEFLCYHQREYFYKWQRGHVAWSMLAQCEAFSWYKPQQLGNRTAKHQPCYAAAMQKQTFLPQYGGQPQASWRKGKKRLPLQTVHKIQEPDASSPSWLSVCFEFFKPQSPCASLSQTLFHFPLNNTCERLFNDSDQCLSGHLGVTAAHTLVGGADDAGAWEAFWKQGVSDKVRIKMLHKLIVSYLKMT